jgi:hypothetical protein
MPHKDSTVQECIPASHSGPSDSLNQRCENCIRWRQKSCIKSRKGGTCKSCSKNHQRCNLTAVVKEHRRAVADPRTRSRSRSIVQQLKSRVSRVASNSDQEIDKSTVGTSSRGRRVNRSCSVTEQSEEAVAKQDRSECGKSRKLRLPFTLSLSRNPSAT